MATEHKHTHTHKHRIWIEPCSSCDCGCSDEDEGEVLNYTYEIPGVPKENIHLHVVKDMLRLVATRHDDVAYVNEKRFRCPIKVDEVETKYENGILTITLPYECEDPFKNSTPIPIE